MIGHRLLPAALLGVWAIAFASNALGGGMLAFDDHPGQLYRLAHALTLGAAPWNINTGWWAGYAELQFYPPGASLLGSLVSYASLGALSLEATYQVLVWLTYLLPGVGTYLLLLRVLGNGWLALPGAFLALSLSAECRSGVEEGTRWGLIAARLGWGGLPLLACSLVSWVKDGVGRPLLAPPLLLGAIILVHPSHAPAAAWLVLSAGLFAPGPASRRLRTTAAVLILGTGMTGFWLIPLFAHLSMAHPLAWGYDSAATLGARFLERPLLGVLTLANAAGWLLAFRPGVPRASRWLLSMGPTLGALVTGSAFLSRPLGLLWLPADRLMDSLLLALVMGFPVLLARLRPLAGDARASICLGTGATALVLLVGLGFRSPTDEPTLTLWPEARRWPTYASVSRGMRLERLWNILREAPAGRILFTRSAVPIESRGDWWRPHSHVTALAPLYAGRGILNGTFTHPSPLAGFFYTGSSAPGPITDLVEERDGRTLFGRPLEGIDGATFARLASALRVSVVVALDEDAGRDGFVSDSAAFWGPIRSDPFRVFVAHSPRPLPEPSGHQRWRVEMPAGRYGWFPVGIAYSPLWRASDERATLRLRRDEIGMLEVEVPDGHGPVIELEHRPGIAEGAGIATSLVCSVMLLTWIWTARRAR